MLPSDQWRERCYFSKKLANEIKMLPSYPKDGIESYDLYKYNPRLKELAELLEMDAAHSIQISEDIIENEAERSKHFVNLKVDGR